MAGKFWPWEVLDLPGMHLPIHPNCGCRLLSLDEALAQGLMDADQLPDTEDAIRRAKILMREAKRLTESLAPEELQEAMEELEAMRLQEVSARQILRFAKGTAKGGEFAPKRGGSAGPKSKREADLHSLRTLAARGGSSPRQERLSRSSRKVTLRGQEHDVPVADAWTHTVAGTTYQSPPGGAHIYRDGILMGHDHPDFYETSLDEPARERPGVPASDRGMDSVQRIKRATVAKPIPDYTGTKLQVAKAAGGSNGALWADDEHGDRWLVKTYGGDQDRIATELLANAIYREMGANVAEAGTWGAPGLPQFETIPDASIDEPPLPKGRGSAPASWCARPTGRSGSTSPRGTSVATSTRSPRAGWRRA
jgi:hypothetical protein